MEGMRRKFDTLFTKKTRHLQVFRFAQCDRRLAMRTRNFLAKVLDGKFDMPATGMTGNFQGFRSLQFSVFEPKRGNTADKKKGRRQAEDEIGGCQ